MSSNETPGTADAATDAVAAVVLLEAVRQDLAALRLPLSLPGAERTRLDLRNAVNQLDDYILPRFRSLDAPLLAVVGGSPGTPAGLMATVPCPAWGGSRAAWWTAQPPPRPIPAPEVPKIEGWPVPTLLIGAGVLLGVVLALAAKFIAGAAASARGAAARKRLEAAVAAVAEDLVVEPVELEVSRLASFTAALKVAAG